MIYFYCYHQNKKIIASDLPVIKIKKKYGYKYEVLATVKEKENIPLVFSRLQRTYHNYEVSEYFYKKLPPFTAEHRQRISASKLGKSRDEATKAKISDTMKGKSNFEGKKHTEKTKKVMSEKKIGNDHAKNMIWAYNAAEDKETRVLKGNKIPEGYIKGRDYLSYEPGLYYFKYHKGYIQNKDPE